MESDIATHQMIQLLRADGPHPDRASELGLFGQFIGTWAMDVRFFDQTGTLIDRFPAEWSFGWILDGRAIQDVLMSAGPKGSTSPGKRRIGTSLRFYDPVLEAWRVVWLGATTETFVVLTGRAVGDEIHLDAVDADGAPLRWRFSEIEADSFRWTGWTSMDGGATWSREQEMEARRGHRTEPEPDPEPQ